MEGPNRTFEDSSNLFQHKTACLPCSGERRQMCIRFHTEKQHMLGLSGVVVTQYRSRGFFCFLTEGTLFILCR